MAVPTDRKDTKTDVASETRRARGDIRAVLDEIGQTEAAAQLDARIAELEHDIGRASSRTEEHERARRGELDVMRARVEDALELVRDSVEEQRSSWSQLEQRLTGLVTETDATTTSALSSLRDELVPGVARVTSQTDEVKAELTGRVEAVIGELEARTEAAAENFEGLRVEVEASIAEVRGVVAAGAETTVEQIAAAEERLGSAVESLRTADAAARDDLSDRVEALRRELDGSAGELRAGLNLKAKEFEDALRATAQDLAGAIDEQGEAFAEFERRWIESTRDLAQRIEDANSLSRSTLLDERGERNDAVDAVRGRIDEIDTRVQQLDGRVATESTRRVTEGETLRRAIDEAGSRLEVLGGRVTTAVDQVASDLANRVASVTAGLEEVRDASVRQGQKLAAVDHLTRKLGEVTVRQEQAAQQLAKVTSDERLDELLAGITQIRKEVQTVASVLKQSRADHQQLATVVATLQEAVRETGGLRAEVRELASRSSELTIRMGETEKLARAAGQAIAAAVRKARQTSARQEPMLLPPPREGAPSVAAAERSPLFQNRERITQPLPEALEHVSTSPEDVAQAIRDLDV